MTTEFVKCIDTKHGKLNFTFTQIYTVNGVIYFTSVATNHAQYYFHMENRGGTWKIVKAPLPPGWIMEHEEEPGKFIEEKLKEGS